MALPHLTTCLDHNPTSRISPSHLLAVQTSSTALQSHLGLNNPTPYALPPPLPISKTHNRPLGLYARLQTHAILLPDSGPERENTTTSLRALTFTDTTAGMHDPEIRRQGLLKRVVVGKGGVSEVRCGTVMVGGKGEQGEEEGEKWILFSVVWERKGGRGKGEGRNGARRGRKMCFALPERGVVRLEGWGSEGGVQVEVNGAGLSLQNIDTTRIVSFSALLSSGEVPVFEFADVDVDVDVEENEGEGGFDARGEDEVEGEEEAEGKGEGEGEGEGMDGVEAGIKGEESGEEDGDREGEVEGEVKVDGEVYGGAMNEKDGDGEEEEGWRSVKRAMGRGGCLVRFYV